MNRRALLAMAVAALAATRAGAREVEHLQRIDDLRAIAAEVVRLRAPLLVLFSTPGCPFCREVRRNYLAPRVAEQGAAPQVLIREVEIGSDRRLIGLDGQTTTEQAFSRRLGVRVVPVVALFDASFALLEEPLVGLDKAGFYEGYLANAIRRAQDRLRS